MTPGEILQLPPQKALILAGGVAPILADKVRYFEDRNFSERCISPARLAKPPSICPPHDWEGVLAQAARPSRIPAAAEPAVQDEFAIFDDPKDASQPTKPSLRVIKGIER